jgi:hypothetical protein
MVRSRPKRGYLVTDRGSTRSRRAHSLFGTNDVPGGTCPNCNKPLLLLLTLDTADRRLGIRDCPMPRLPLLFCWTCNVAQSNFVYRLEADAVQLVEFGVGGVVTDFPYPSYPTNFPQRAVKLEPLTDLDQQMIHLINEGELEPIWGRQYTPIFTTPVHQVGGEPLGSNIDFDTDRECRECGSSMRFLASIADDAGDGLAITQNAYVQTLFFLCRKCWLIMAQQICD